MNNIIEKVQNSYMTLQKHTFRKAGQVFYNGHKFSRSIAPIKFELRLLRERERERERGREGGVIRLF